MSQHLVSVISAMQIVIVMRHPSNCNVSVMIETTSCNDSVVKYFADCNGPVIHCDTIKFCNPEHDRL